MPSSPSAPPARSSTTMPSSPSATAVFFLTSLASAMGEDTNASSPPSGPPSGPPSSFSAMSPDIVKQGQRKSRYLFSFLDLLASISCSRIGELADLGTAIKPWSSSRSSIFPVTNSGSYRHSTGRRCPNALPAAPSSHHRAAVVSSVIVNSFTFPISVNTSTTPRRIPSPVLARERREQKKTKQAEEEKQKEK